MAEETPPPTFTPKTYLIRTDLAEWLEEQARRRDLHDVSIALNRVVEEVKERMESELTIGEAAIEKGVTWQSIRDAIKREKLNFRRRGKIYFVQRDKKFTDYQPRPYRRMPKP